MYPLKVLCAFLNPFKELLLEEEVKNEFVKPLVDLLMDRFCNPTKRDKKDMKILRNELREVMVPYFSRVNLEFETILEPFDKKLEEVKQFLDQIGLYELSITYFNQ